MSVPNVGHAQVTATLTGTVQDSTGGVIPNAKVTLTDEATKEGRVETTNGAGLFAFPSLVPGTYDLKAAAKGFEAKVVTGIVLNAGDTREVPALSLAVGAETLTVTVSASEEMIPVENGQHTDVLSSKDIDTLALEGRDTTELLKVLPGAVTQSGGLTNTSPTFSDLTVTVDESSLGAGTWINGAIYRGGESILVDGAETIDIGDMASSLVIVPPEMTSQVAVQSSNMSADQPFGPVVVSTISKSGSANYHGEGYFDARNNALNANGWQQNNSGTPLGPQHFYYPGGNVGGPVPGTHKHLLFWGGYEKWLQNQGSQNVATSYIPTPAMMGGDFTEASNSGLCPNGMIFGLQDNAGVGTQSPSGPPSVSGAGSWCSDLSGAILANGGNVSTLPNAWTTGGLTATIGGKVYNVDAGQKFTNGNNNAVSYVDTNGAAALAKIWPAATSTVGLSVCGGCNYYQPVTSVPNGWIYRARVDYQWGDNTKVYASYEQAYSTNLAGTIGAHLYWTPGNSIPYPGGAETESDHGKVLAGHIVHNFNSTTTNDFLAAWAYGSYPFVTPDPSAAYKTTLGYKYNNVFTTPTLNIPAYSSAGNFTFPDFSQASIFENPPGMYGVKKEAPQFADTLTKVWGTHTVKIGGFTQTTDNWQSSFNYDLDGSLGFGAGQHPDALPTGPTNEGVPYNSTAQFVSGIATSYSQNNAAPIGDVAELNTAAFVDDTWKTSKRLTLELGIRMEHVGHWYDRDHVGLAVFYANRVLSDWEAGKSEPGFYWHANDAGVPLSGQPNRFAYPDGRFGLSYDVFGTGNTVVRGGWGVYRFVTQVNTVANGQMAGTADGVLGYSIPGSHDVQLQNIGGLAYQPCPNPLATPVVTAPCGANQGSQYGLNPSDYGQPMTQSYNLTIDQKLHWNTQLELAYVGNQSSQLVDGSEDIEASDFNALTDQNKTPIGALFLPDPVTGHTATNPENVTCDPNFTGAGSCIYYGHGINSGINGGNTLADYHPYGYAYGNNSIYMYQSRAYANYNAVQASWIKTTGRLTFDFNGTWGKALGTTLQTNPFSLAANYGPTAEDRPFIFNSTYTYSSGTLHYDNGVLNALGSGWTINGISTWQAGGYVPAFLGNGVPNFGMGLGYVDQPANASAAGVGKGVGNATYFGTDANLPPLPVLTCNPTKGLGTHQILNGTCFTAPALHTNAFGVANGTSSPVVSANGGFAYPYMRMTPYFDNDLAIYRTFHVHENQSVQIRASAFDWLNHSLLTFSSSGRYTLGYNVDYQTQAVTSTTPTTFGTMDVRSALPYARVIELDAKYSF
ncbi:MAG: carboxypeptidase-like regulatory domain-containing protein [Terracidiphilus sp.]